MERAAIWTRLRCLPAAVRAATGGAALALSCAAPPSHPVAFANGLKTGEVGPDRALVWTRLAERPSTRPGEELPAAAGEVRLRCWPAGASPSASAWTAWTAVQPERDSSHQFPLEGLEPGRRYQLELQARAAPGEAAAASLHGGFRTAPAPDQPAPVRFTVVTGQDFHRRDDPERGHLVYASMQALAPSFFVHTGDIVYYDKPEPLAKTVEVARHHWRRMYALPLQREFHRQVPAYFLKDDHDTLKNDCWPGQRYGELSWEDGLGLFREQVPMGQSTYRTARWGQDLQLWFLEGRDFRSPNRDPDGPAKTILGAEQLAWLERSLAASDATFRLVVSPTPIVGPDRANKNDNHANHGFRHEGDRLRSLLGGLPGVYVVCGDRHWQYVSEHAATGLREYSCGPTTDRHAGGFRERDRRPEHRFLRVRGGFLSVEVGRTGGQPWLAFRHHAVDGAVVHEERHAPPAGG